MNNRLVSKINKVIYKKFPDFTGVVPKIKRQPVPKSEFSNKGKERYLLTYKSKGTTTTKKSFPKYVRVVVNETGKIIKISSSK